ncbi:MAG: GNAT family N-acetyltransferase [Actinobacteria bacterium]|nr:GNAT family N-acetyltransferase [Actinomycetota bacterium]
MDLFLGTAFQDRGLGTDAVRTMARYLIEGRGHHRLTIDPAARNERAIRCYEKAGFRRVGAGLRRGRRDGARLAHRSGSSPRHPCRQRPRAPLRLAGGATPWRCAAGWASPATRASGCSRSRSSSGSGRTAVGTAIPARAGAGRPSTSRCRRCGACASSGA